MEPAPPYSRPRTGLLFAAFGALAALAVFVVMGTGDVPTEAVPIIALATLASGLMGWLFAHKLATPFRAFAILTGAVVMMGAQIPFAFMTTVYFWIRDPAGSDAFWQSIAILIVGGWSVAAPFQVVAGALAGWLLHFISAQQPE